MDLVQSSVAADGQEVGSRRYIFNDIAVLVIAKPKVQRQWVVPLNALPVAFAAKRVGFYIAVPDPATIISLAIKRDGGDSFGHSYAVLQL